MWCPSFALPEPADPKLRGPNFAYDQVHLGVGAASLGNVCVGLYGLWHNAHFNQSFHDISCDLGLLISNDGLHFREPSKGHVFIRRDDSPMTPMAGQHYNTNLCQGNGILNVGEKTLIYHGRWRNVGNRPEHMANYRAEVALATLPRDRWGSLRLTPEAQSGSVCTALLELPSAGEVPELHLNADGAALFKVELLDESYRPIPGYHGDKSGTLGASDGLHCPVHFAEGSLKKLSGRSVRVQVSMKRGGGVEPRLYALYL
jgi:hypothetical protein